MFKICASWEDDSTRELKTYSLCCRSCISTQFASANARHARCRLAPGEKLGLPAVFELSPDTRDRDLLRRTDLETGRAGG